MFVGLAMSYTSGMALLRNGTWRCLNRTTMHVCNEPHRNGLWGTQVSHGALGAVKRWRVSGSRTFAAAAAALLLAGCAANLPQEDTPAPEQVEAVDQRRHSEQRGDEQIEDGQRGGVQAAEHDELHEELQPEDQVEVGAYGIRPAKSTIGGWWARCRVSECMGRQIMRRAEEDA